MFKQIRKFEGQFSIAKAAGIVGFFTLVIKFVAIYRERLFSGTFGQGPILDSYFSAFRIPDFLTNLFVLSTLSVAFLPIFTGLAAEDEQKAYRFANKILMVSAAAISVFCLILFFLSEPLTRKLVPGFSGQQFSDTLKLTRLFFISPLIFTLGTIYGGILNAKKQFLISSFAPLLYNLGIIAGVLFLYPKFGIMGLGYSVILGALAQLAIQIITAAKEGYVFSFKTEPEETNTRNMWQLYLPRIFSFDLSNITLLLGTIVGSVLVAGSIASLNQAYNLQSVPVSVFGYSIALAVFPSLSEYFARGKHKEFIATLGRSINQTLFFIIPISILTIIFRAYIVRLILGTGHFTWEDTIRTFQVLGIFSLSFPSQSMTTLLSRAFFARHNTKIPVLVNIGAIVINVIFGVILGHMFKVQGLAAAFVIASIANAVLLYAFLRKDLGQTPENQAALNEFDASIYTAIWKVLAASIVMGLVSYACLYALAPLLNTHKVIGIVLQAGISGAVGMAAFAIMCNYLQIAETQSALERIRRMF